MRWPVAAFGRCGMGREWWTAAHSRMARGEPGTGRIQSSVPGVTPASRCRRSQAAFSAEATTGVWSGSSRSDRRSAWSW